MAHLHKNGTPYDEDCEFCTGRFAPPQEVKEPVGETWGYDSDGTHARDKAPTTDHSWEDISKWRGLLASFLKDIDQYATYGKGYEECKENYAELIIAEISIVASKERQAGRDEAVDYIERECPDIEGLKTIGDEIGLRVRSMPEGTTFQLLPRQVADAARRGEKDGH